MQSIFNFSSSTSSINSNDTEYGYGTMLDGINHLIQNYNSIAVHNQAESEEESKEQIKTKKYKALYRGVNFSNYQFKNNIPPHFNPKLTDAKHTKRRLTYKKKTVY